ncbi:MAG TPA: hypothetical protein PLH37_00630 [bacterium]|nr:hypothetical protein [bacterium]
MNKINYTKILKANWQLIAVIAAAVVVLTVGLSLLRPFEYRSRTNLLVIQKQALSLDAYASARASERLASNLASVVKTESFFAQVLNSNFDIKVAWPSKENERRDFWKKMITTSIAPETGILTVDVFYKDDEQAKIISQAVAYVLVNKSAEYHGGGDSVVIKVVDPALVSNYPVRPNLIFNILSALIVGLFLGVAVVIYNAQRKIRQLVAEDEPSVPQSNQRGNIRTMLEEPFGAIQYMNFPENNFNNNL